MTISCHNILGHMDEKGKSSSSERYSVLAANCLFILLTKVAKQQMFFFFHIQILITMWIKLLVIGDH